MSSSIDRHRKKFAHLQIPREEILSSTNNFSEANLITYIGGEPKYKGHLLWSGQLLDIVAHIWMNHSDYDDLFWKEVSMLSTLKHKNLASLVGFCDDKGHKKILIYKNEAKGTLDKFLQDPALTWLRRLHIFVGVAQALSYLYYEEGRNFSVVHCNVRSIAVLVDDQWNAKLRGFFMSLKQIAGTRNPVRLSEFYKRDLQYADPAALKSDYASHKLDIYSFGVLLFEGLTGEESVKDRLLAPLAKSCYEEGRLDDIIFPGLQKQMDPQSLKIFSETAYYCFKEQLSQRPDIHQVLVKLTEALEA